MLNFQVQKVLMTDLILAVICVLEKQKLHANLLHPLRSLCLPFRHRFLTAEGNVVTEVD